MSKQILFNEEARKKLLEGVNDLNDAVKSSLGPSGHTVCIQKEIGSPIVTKDGVTIAKNISFSDPIKNVGAQLVKDVAIKTGDSVGDGTTTATVLAQAIIKEGIKYVSAGGNPIDLKRGIDKAINYLVKRVKETSENVGDNYTSLLNIATISANNDKEIGNLIAQAFEKVKKDGIITIGESKGIDTYIEVIEGLNIDRGYLSPYFCTDVEKMICEFENPYILFSENKISSFRSLIPILEQVHQSGRPLLIIAEDVDGEALSTLVINRLRSNLKVCAIKASSFGDRKKDLLKDEAILTNGVVCSNDTGVKIEDLTLESLGQCEKIIVSKNDTIIIGGKGDKEEIEERLTTLRYTLENCTNDYDKEKVQEEITSLTGAAAVLYIGASSELEYKEKKDRVDDALSATRAAIEEGIVPGGGALLVHLSKELEELIGENQDEQYGIRIIQNAICEPAKIIAENAGVNGSVVVNDILNKDFNFGFNAKSLKFENLIESGIIDPAKVTRLVLQNSSSIASMFLLTNCVICEEKKEETKNIAMAQQN